MEVRHIVLLYFSLVFMLAACGPNVNDEDTSGPRQGDGLPCRCAAAYVEKQELISGSVEYFKCLCNSKLI